MLKMLRRLHNRLSAEQHRVIENFEYLSKFEIFGQIYLYMWDRWDGMINKKDKKSPDTVSLKIDFEQ